MSFSDHVSALDSPIFGNGFSDPEMRKVFSHRAFIARCVEVEIALAEAQARLGIIPEAAYAGIRDNADVEKLDMERMARETAIVGYPILPLVEQLVAQCGEAGRYVHWGATTQDIMDTATVLQLRDALGLIEAKIESLRAILARLARDYRDTPMAGRTHLQHALPITFGYKAAVWLSMLDRHTERLAQLRPRVLVGQFSGASGTLASLGKDGLDVQRELMAVLGLAVPAITWHSARDGVAEAVQVLGLITGSLAKIAVDVSVMMMTEIGEVSEPFVPHRGASSTMPQKTNPISCELILASSKVVRQHAGLMLDAMVHDFERATGPWHLEWFAVPESFALTSGALYQAEFLLNGLRVNPSNMARNLAFTRGLIVSEAVMMALAPHMGRQQAHDLVYAACRNAVENDRTLFDALKEVPEVTKALGEDQLARLVDPANYVGQSPQMVDRMVEGR